MSPKDFKQVAKQVKHFVDKQLPAIVGIEARKHFKESFRDEGFIDQTLEKWPDVTEARKVQKTRKNGRRPPILTDTGDLGDSLNWSEDYGKVTVSSDLPYAQRHNEGTAGMPKRQFMGRSTALENKIIGKSEKELNKIFKR